MTIGFALGLLLLLAKLVVLRMLSRLPRSTCTEC